jgi:hypothetical protein
MMIFSWDFIGNHTRTSTVIYITWLDSSANTPVSQYSCGFELFHFVPREFVIWDILRELFGTLFDSLNFVRMIRLGVDNSSCFDTVIDLFLDQILKLFDEVKCYDSEHEELH